MAAKVKPGWYRPDGAQYEQHWNGASWELRFRPLPLADGTPAGWYEETAGVERWWSGSSWADARRAADRRTDVVQHIGQAILTEHVLGGGDDQAIAALMRTLQTFPPCRIVSLNTAESRLAPGAQLVAVVEW